MDLRRQVSRKLPKKNGKNLIRNAPTESISKAEPTKIINPISPIIPRSLLSKWIRSITMRQIGPFLQTFKFVRAGILLALYRNEKPSASMKEGIDILESILGTELFRKYVHVLLTDRGTEFSAAEAMEASHDGTRRTRVFYCDPMQSGQKGSRWRIKPYRTPLHPSKRERI